MRPHDGNEIVYAGAGLLWGIVTCVRSYQVWRENQRHAGALSTSSGLLVHFKSTFPFTMVTGAGTALLCGVYLIFLVG